MLDALWGPIAPAFAVPLLIGLIGLVTVLGIVCLRLQRQNARLTLALSNTPQGLCMWDPNGRLLVCNEPDGSLVATHHDVTKQLDRERTRRACARGEATHVDRDRHHRVSFRAWRACCAR